MPTGFDGYWARSETVNWQTAIQLKNTERGHRARHFIDTLIRSLSEASAPQTKIGFDLLPQDQQLRQSTGQECLWACAVIAARALGVTKQAFDPTVAALHQQAMARNIVDPSGVDIRYQDIVKEILASAGFKTSIVTYSPNDMRPEDITSLGKRIITAIKDGQAVISLDPNQKHFKLIHTISASAVQIYDPFWAADLPWELPNFAVNVGHIVNGEMQGNRLDLNVILFLKPKDQPTKTGADADFIVHDQFTLS